MQDRFRFRVWYRSFGEIVPKMLYDAEQAYDYMFGEPESIPAKSFGSVLNNEDEYIVMQCTGLKDKNGKLIYEGDILKLAEFGKPVEVKHRALGFVLRREPSNTVGYDNDKYIPEDCEVIGNIYENPELLEDNS